MFKNQIDIRLKHEKFIKKVCETNIFYGLENEYGFATSSSNQYEDDEGEPVEVICFWSDQILAKVCAKNEWKEYKVVPVDLNDFIENWCIGIHNDGLLVGTNFDHNMFGNESEGYVLILELIDEIKKIKMELKFQKFNNIEDLESKIKKILGN